MKLGEKLKANIQHDVDEQERAEALKAKREAERKLKERNNHKALISRIKTKLVAQIEGGHIKPQTKIFEYSQKKWLYQCQGEEKPVNHDLYDEMVAFWKSEGCKFVLLDGWNESQSWVVASVTVEF